MNLNNDDRSKLEFALKKLSTSATEMAAACSDVRELVSRLDSMQEPQLEARPTPTPTPEGQPEVAVPAAPLQQQPTPPYPGQHSPNSGHIPFGNGAQPNQQTPANPYRQRPQPNRQPVGQPAGQPAPRQQQRPIFAATADSYRPPSRPQKKQKPPLSTEAKIIRGISISGALTTILGVILLVSVAIQRGWIGPLGRVIATFVFSALLVGAATWVRKNNKSRVEAVVALVVTAQFAAVADTIAITYVLEWWPKAAGSAVMLALSTLFLILGRFWVEADSKGKETSQQQIPLSGPPVFMGVSILSGLFALYSSAAHEGFWPMLSIIIALVISFRGATTKLRNALAVLAVTLQLFSLACSWFTHHHYFGISIGIATPILLVALTLWDRTSEAAADVNKSDLAHYWEAFSTYRSTAFFGTISPTLILLFLIPELDDKKLIWLLLVPTTAIALLGIYSSLVPNRAKQSVDKPAPSLSGVVSAQFSHLAAVFGLSLVALSFVLIHAKMDQHRPWFERYSPLQEQLSVILFFAVGSAVFLVLKFLSSKKDFGIVPLLVWLVSGVLTSWNLLGYVVLFQTQFLTVPIILAQVAPIVLFIGVAIFIRESFYQQLLWVQIAVGLCLLILSMIAIVATTTFLGNSTGSEDGSAYGWLIGHATVSVLWMVIAAILMLREKLLDKTGALWAGLALSSAGIIKLVFFDLTKLSGIPRATAFLLSGIALLSVAALRGRRTKNRDDKTDPDAATPSARAEKDKALERTES